MPCALLSSLTSGIEDVVHPCLRALLRISGLHEATDAVLRIQETADATLLTFAGQVGVFHVDRKVLRRTARTTSPPVRLLSSVGDHLIEAVVRDHLVLGGTVVVRQAAHVVLEAADGRLPQIDLGLILGRDSGAP